jgi:hypothetical protein
VAEEVAGPEFVDAAAAEEFFDPVADVFGGDAGAVAAEEEGGFVREVGELGAGFVQEFLQPCSGAFAYGQEAEFSSFAAADGEGVGGGIVVAEVEVAEFGTAQAGGVEEFEHGAIAQAEGIGCVRVGEEEFDFVSGEGFGE